MNKKLKAGEQTLPTVAFRFSELPILYHRIDPCHRVNEGWWRLQGM